MRLVLPGLPELDLVHLELCSGPLYSDLVHLELCPGLPWYILGCALDCLFRPGTYKECPGLFESDQIHMR